MIAQTIHRTIRTAALLLLLLAWPALVRAEAQPITLDAPGVVFSGQPVTVTATGERPLLDGAVLRMDGRTLAATDTDAQTASYRDIRLADSGPRRLVLVSAEGAVLAAAEVSVIPGWASVVPPFVAIAFALIFRSVLPALFVGIWCGAWLAAGLSLGGLWRGFMASFDTHLVAAMADADRIKIILFTMMMGGMIGILSKNGGMQGIVAAVTGIARTPRRGQLTTAGLGLAIFFDDIANTLLIGKTMQPVTDRLRISREKLAYLVDSTAAPIASIAFATTWIGYQVSVIDATVGGMADFDQPAYALFLASLPHAYYPLLTLFLVFAIAASGRDFGPMLTAERRARLGHRPATPGTADAPDPTRPQPRMINAVVPIATLIVTLIATLYATGSGDSFRQIIGSADSFQALLAASFLGVAVAGALTLAQRLLSLEALIDAWFDGVMTTFLAMIILVLAWTLSDLTQTLHTADFLIAALGDRLAPGLLPAITFVLAALVAFTTGTSWGTMGILMPLVLPLAWGVLDISGLTDPAHMHILYGAVAAVLAGATFGDHCSPISDTTVLSSAASGCNHIEHVRTQLPYALTTGIVATVVCAIPVGYGAPWWLCLLLGAAVIWLGLTRFGKRSDAVRTPSEPAGER